MTSGAVAGFLWGVTVSVAVLIIVFWRPRKEYTPSQEWKVPWKQHATLLERHDKVQRSAVAIDKLFYSMEKVQKETTEPMPWRLLWWSYQTDILDLLRENRRVLTETIPCYDPGFVKATPVIRDDEFVQSEDGE